MVECVVNRYWLGGVRRRDASVILFVYSVILSSNENFRNVISWPDDSKWKNTSSVLESMLERKRNKDFPFALTMKFCPRSYLM